SFVAGSTMATVEDVTSTVPIEVGDRIAGFEAYEFEHEVFVVSCSSDCQTAGSTIELSEPASATESGALRQIYTKHVAGVSGSWKVGDHVVGAKFEGLFDEYLPPGTVVTAIGSGT